MADRANSTSAPEIHALSGSSKPSGQPPQFDPVASVMPAAPAGGGPSESWEFRSKVATWANATLESLGYGDCAEKIETIVEDAGIPEELFVRDDDAALFDNVTDMHEFGGKRWFGGPETIKHLLAQAKGEIAVPGRLKSVERSTRIDEILTAYDTWEASGDYARQSRASIECMDRSAAIGREADDLRDEILLMRVVTLEGVLTKAKIAYSLHQDEWGDLSYLEERVDAQGTNGPDSTYCIVRDLYRLAIERRITVEGLAGEPVPEPKPKPIITHEELAALAFKPMDLGDWRPPTLAEWIALENPVLVSLRVAESIVKQDKPSLIKTVEALDAIGEDEAEKIGKQLQSTVDFFKACADVAESATIRFMSASANVYEDVEEPEDDPAESRAA